MLPVESCVTTVSFPGAPASLTTTTYAAPNMPFTYVGPQESPVGTMPIVTYNHREESSDEAANAAHLYTVVVNGREAPLCEVEVPVEGVLADLKSAITKAVSVASREQQLYVVSSGLNLDHCSSKQPVCELFPAGKRRDVRLVRREGGRHKDFFSMSFASDALERGLTYHPSTTLESPRSKLLPLSPRQRAHGNSRVSLPHEAFQRRSEREPKSPSSVKHSEAGGSTWTSTVMDSPRSQATLSPKARSFIQESSAKMSEREPVSPRSQNGKPLSVRRKQSPGSPRSPTKAGEGGNKIRGWQERESAASFAYKKNSSPNNTTPTGPILPIRAEYSAQEPTSAWP
jgi:hypothetical protein